MLEVNKSHAAGYAILSYRTAYLKANYFLEYATSVLRSVEGDKKRLTEYASIVKSRGVEILFPCVNKSSKHMDIFNFEKNVISTGLMAVSGLPEEMAGHIIEEREKNGDFVSYEDFLNRMMNYHIDAKSIKSLINAGAFDIFDKNVNRLLAQYNHVSGVFAKKQDLASQPVKSIFDIPEFSKLVAYLECAPDDNGYSLQERLSSLCEANNVGIHSDVTSSYKNIRNDLTLDKFQRDPEFDSKRGVVTAILEDSFEISKKGKAYLAKAINFNGELIKLIVSKAKVDDITDDINKYKKGMAIDIYGTFRFPKASESSGQDGEEEAQGFDNDEIVCFPNDIQIKELDTPWIPLYVTLDFDNMTYDKDMVVAYHGGNNFNEVVKNILNREASDNGKVVSIINGGVVFKAPHRIDITMDEIHKLGCSYTFE